MLLREAQLEAAVDVTNRGTAINHVMVLAKRPDKNFLLIIFVLDHSEIQGPVNAVVSDPPRQREFTRALGRALGKPAFMPLPGIVLKGLMGEMAGVLLASQRAVPNAMKAAGFKFEFGELEKALDDLIRGDDLI